MMKNFKISVAKFIVERNSLVATGGAIYACFKIGSAILRNAANKAITFFHVFFFIAFLSCLCNFFVIYDVFGFYCDLIVSMLFFVKYIDVVTSI